MKTLILTLYLAIALCSCAATHRKAVPVELMSKAGVIGHPAVRDFADDFSPTLQASLIESFRQTRNSPQTTSEPTSLLALSGGGAYGAFGAGLMCGWAKAGTRPVFRLVTGVSTGALIAPYVFLGSAEDGALRRVYTTISTKDIYRDKWPFESLFGDGSMFNTNPFAELLIREIDDKKLVGIAAAHRQGRRLFMGTTNMDAGKLVIWDMGAIAASGGPGALELFRDVMRASSAIPVAFPSTRFDVEADGRNFKEIHSDGGVTAGVFLLGFAMHWREAELEAGMSPRPAQVFVIRNGQLRTSWRLSLSEGSPIQEPSTKGLIGAQIVGDLYRIHAVARREDISFQWACIPDDYEPRPRESFDPIEMNRMFELGFNSARDGYEWRTRPPGLRP